MKRTKQEYLNVLNETIEHYTSKGVERSLNNSGKCMYYSSGKTCAVGRCLVNPKDKDRLLSHVEDGSNDVQSLLRRFSDVVFKEQYRGYSVRFWEELQAIHDADIYWHEDEIGVLTEHGEEAVKDLEKLIKYNY